VVQKQERKIDKGKTPFDIILRSVRAVKIHNLCIIYVICLPTNRIRI